jgi:peptidoglycan/xylan/chitin deacetylase (PgdA/CDA1 family)
MRLLQFPPVLRFQHLPRLQYLLRFQHLPRLQYLLRLQDLLRLQNLLRLKHLLLPFLFALPAAHGADAQPSPTSPAPIRFLLTFDDGPSGASGNNATVTVLDTLAHNPVQGDIKAVFFTQTRHWHGGSTDIGRALIRREHADGHVVALHTATALHANHRFMDADTLDSSLRRGVDDLRDLTGAAPVLVRPPFWAYDAATLDGYHRHGLHMLLTDLNANDGKIWGVNFSWHKRANMLKMLAETRARWSAGSMRTVDGHTPVVVTFHDVNSYTARHLEEYLRILLDVARELDVPVADKPFYDERTELERAALASTIASAAEHPRLPGLWNWLWQ